MAWLYVLAAGIVEVVWVIGLRYSTAWWHWLGTVLTIVLSFFLIIKATEQLPAGTVYVVFTGIGTAGIVVMDAFVFHTDISALKLLCIGFIVLGVVGLKMNSELHRR
ncbi:MAG: multidrug resistance protein SMR [Bacillaceae bacterium G1]|nr:QacE family quaternary ammonium compound efflux SMR transporter [Bacillota bacterium]OJF17599.1 MAG: multidrug resistance protein SMR [Bacillaceae bacterium G1]